MKVALAELLEMDPMFMYSRDGVLPGGEGHELMAQQIIDFFAVKPPLKDPHPNAYGRMMMFLRERMLAKRDAWLTEIGHKRPMRKGKPLAEANKIAAENTTGVPWIEAGGECDWDVTTPCSLSSGGYALDLEPRSAWGLLLDASCKGI